MDKIWRKWKLYSKMESEQPSNESCKTFDIPQVAINNNGDHFGYSL